MTSAKSAPTPTNETSSFFPLRSIDDHDPSQNSLLSSTSSPSVVRNPSPPPVDDLTREDMVGDEMYSKSWFCQVLLKLIQFVAPGQLHDEIFASIRQQDDGFLATNAQRKQELDETFESELCELWDVSMSADVAHFLIEFNSLDLFNVVLIECKDKRCTEIVLGILSNMACCKRTLPQQDEAKSVALCIVRHTNLLSTVLSILTSDDYSDCPTLVQLFRLLYTLLVRQDTRALMLEHVHLTYEPLCFILQSCCNKELLEQCSCLLRVLLDECNLFESEEHPEIASLMLTSVTTAIAALLDTDTVSMDSTLENLFNCLQIYTTYERCTSMLNDHCQEIIKLIETTLKCLVQDDIVQIHSVILLSCISICNVFLDKHGLKIITRSLLEYLIIVGHACYKDKQRREHQKHAVRRQRSRTHSHSSNKRKDPDASHTNGKKVVNNDDDTLSKSHNPLTHVDWEDDSVVQSTAPADLSRTASEDLSATSYGLVDELFLELFHRGVKQDGGQTADTSSSVFTQLSHDQREVFRKIIKHFCNIDKRLDDMLDL